MQARRIDFVWCAVHTDLMTTRDMEAMRVLPLQTRVNKAEHDTIRGAMEADRMGPTAWIRAGLLALAGMKKDARQALITEVS